MASINNDWQTDYKTVTERVSQLLENDKLQDCTFEVGQGKDMITIRSHRLILSMASSVFHSMFYEEQTMVHDTIQLPEIEPEMFMAMLRYIYQNNIEFESYKMACNLYKIADEYKLMFLKNACLSYMESNINTNSCEAYQYGTRHQFMNIAEAAMDNMRDNTKTVLSNIGQNNIDLDTLIAIFDQEYLNIESELDLIDAINIFVEQNQYMLEENGLSLRNAIRKIRFLTLLPQQFVDGPDKYDWLTSSEKITILQKISSPESAISMPDGFSTSMLNRNSKHGPYLYCKRPIINEIIWRSPGNWFSLTSSHLSSLSFKVDKSTLLKGIQIASQNSSELKTYMDNIYVRIWCHTESINKIAELTFNSDVSYNKLIDIYFATACNIEPDKIYQIEIGLQYAGDYPMLIYDNTIVRIAKRTFQFGVMNKTDIRPGLIQSLIFAFEE